MDIGNRTPSLRRVAGDVGDWASSVDLISSKPAFRLALLPARVVAAIICGIMIPHKGGEA